MRSAPFRSRSGNTDLNCGARPGLFCESVETGSEWISSGEKTMSQNEPWGANGVACLKAACAAADHHKRAVLVHLGGFWISLAHAPPAHIDSVMAARIAAMERIQAELLGTPPTPH